MQWRKAVCGQHALPGELLVIWWVTFCDLLTAKIWYKQSQKITPPKLFDQEKCSL